MDELPSYRRMAYAQEDATIRFAWGALGLQSLLPDSEVIVLVDVLSFSTSVDLAVSQGAHVYPYPWKADRAEDFARRHHAILAGKPGQDGLTLSPSSLVDLPLATKMVMPSPNGSTLSLATGERPTLTGCLRNAAAVAKLAQSVGRKVTVIAAGERWPDGSLRPAVEDYLGAGAIISRLEGKQSVEAALAARLFGTISSELDGLIHRCVSGQELIHRGLKADVDIAAMLDVSSSVPFLRDGAYVNETR